MADPDKNSAETPEVTVDPIEQKRFSAILDQEIMKRFGLPPEKVDPKAKEKFSIYLKKLKIDGHIEPEKDPEALDAAIKQLDLLGLKTKTDIHRESLVIENEADKKTAEIHERVRRGKLPTLAYETNTGIYGFAAEVLGNLSLLVYSKDLKAKVLDAIENLFFRKVNKKGTMEQVARNINELGLRKFFDFEVGPNGKVPQVREKTEDYQEGFILDDLLRLRDTKGREYLKKFDPRSAIAETVKMVDQVHQKAGRGIGELGAQDVVMQVKNGVLVGSRLTIPDTVYHPSMEVLEQKSWDIVDLLFSVGTAGFQHGGAAEAQSNIQLVMANYSDKTVLAKVKALVGNGEPKLNMWSRAKFGFDRVKDKALAEKTVREAITA